MNNWFKTWTRPSIQQPRWIANTVKTLFKPLTISLNYVKDYWDTWDRVYQPEKKDVDSK